MLRHGAELTDPSPDSAIHVVLTFDDDFWAPAYTVMRSICLTTFRRKDLVFHLLHDDLRPERAADLERITEEFGARVARYELSDNAEFNAICRQLPVDRRLHVVMYARLLLDRILPAGIGRVIYLDSDTMALTAIEHLYEQEMDGHPIAAVSDPRRTFNMMGRDMREKREIFDPASPYFNSGVMLIDLPKFASFDVAARLEELKQRGIIQKLYFDQDILNLIFAGRWKPLHWRFNVMEPRVAHQALDPYIVHYTGTNRPWKLFSTVAFGRPYRHVMTNELFWRYLRHRAKQFWFKKLGLMKR